MPYPYIREDSLDDLMRSVIQELLATGERIKPTKDWCTELCGVLLELSNPLARLSRTETRGKPFSALGELCWYLAKRNDLGFIEYYIREYTKSAEDGIIYGAYGPRLFDWDGVNQIANIATRLKANPVTRKTCVQLFNASDIQTDHKDTPCTCTLQFMLRGGKLNMVTYMRSNDVYWGMPHDIFCFTMLQEIIAREVSADLGSYKHVVGSLHLYDDKKDAAMQFLNEGFQSTDLHMPPMPNGNPWPSIGALLQAESEIRLSRTFDEQELDDLDPYWADLVRLLLVFRNRNDVNRITELRDKMSSPVFRTSINMRIAQLS